MPSNLWQFGGIVGLVFIMQCSANELGVASFYGRAYFGDPIGQLSDGERQAFERGEKLFAKSWPSPKGAKRNASSCVTCHSVPAPGGSGMSDSALVATRIVAGRSQVVYKIQTTPRAGLEARRTPPLFGLGLIESSDTLIGGDGRRTRFFGALAEHESISSAIEHAVEFELGLKTVDTCRRRTASKKGGCTPDMSAQDFLDLTQYVRFLAAPPRHYVDVRVEIPGREIFARIGCVNCHTPTFSTMKSRFPSLRTSALAAYTDFQLHDVGGEYKVRTTALWGLNSYGPPYWHDGGAQSVDAAIRKHSGEAATVRSGYERLSIKERSSLLNFLKGL